MLLQSVYAVYRSQQRLMSCNLYKKEEKKMKDRKRKFADKGPLSFLVITIVCSVLMETVIIVQKTMGVAVFLMWIPAFAAIVADCISQTENKGTISCKLLLNRIGFRKSTFRWIMYSCVIPFLYIGIPYIIFWIISPESLNLSSTFVKQLIIMSLLGILVGVLTALGEEIGEEIGWRGYLVPALTESLGTTKALIFTSLFWRAWHLPILISGLYMPGTPIWYKVPAFLLMILPVGMIYGIVAIKTRSVWPAAVLHAAHNTFDQTIFGPVTIADNKMFFVSETGIFTILCAWILAIMLYRKLDIRIKN